MRKLLSALLYTALVSVANPSVADMNAIADLRTGDMRKLIFHSTPMEGSDVAFLGEDGDEMSLAAYEGQYVVLNFWATWCPPCRREMPSMQRLYEKFNERGLVVVAVNQFEDPDLVFEFTGRLSLEPTFPILFDRESRVSEQFKVKGLPTTYLLDKQGKIRYRAIGGREFDHPEVEALIEGLL